MRSSYILQLRALRPICSLAGIEIDQLVADFHRVSLQQMLCRDQGLDQYQTTYSSVLKWLCSLQMRRSLWSIARESSRLRQVLTGTQFRKDWHLPTCQLRFQLYIV